MGNQHRKEDVAQFPCTTAPSASSASSFSFHRNAGVALQYSSAVNILRDTNEKGLGRAVSPSILRQPRIAFVVSDMFVKCVQMRAVSIELSRSKDRKGNSNCASGIGGAGGRCVQWLA